MILTEAQIKKAQESYDALKHLFKRKKLLQHCIDKGTKIKVIAYGPNPDNPTYHEHELLNEVYSLQYENTKEVGKFVLLRAVQRTQDLIDANVRQLNQLNCEVPKLE